ncbi:MAG: hypothetical protein ACOYVF_06170 [Candidatus Zixiibacteriota bacterium]
MKFENQNNKSILFNFNQVLEEIDEFNTNAITTLSPFINQKTATSSKNALSVTDYQSDYLFIPKELYGGSSVFNKVVSYNEFEGNIISAPYGIIAIIYQDPVSDYCRDYLFITDPGWNRIIASERTHWITDYGSHGTGISNFSFPAAIAFVDWCWIVADAYNNRVQVYYLDYSDELTYKYSILDNFGSIRDVDAARIPLTDDPADDIVEIAVLDYDNSVVKFYDHHKMILSSHHQMKEKSTYICVHYKSVLVHGALTMTRY